MKDLLEFLLIMFIFFALLGGIKVSVNDQVYDFKLIIEDK